MVCCLFYARFCGCYLVKQQPSLSFLLAAATIEDRIEKHQKKKRRRKKKKKKK
jgi:hypothetical protein